MNVLILTHYNFNTGLTGSTSRVLYLARNLPPGVNVTIIHRGDDFQSGDVSFIGYRGQSLLGPYLEFLSPDLHAKLKGLQTRYDVIQVESPYLFPAAILYAGTSGNRPRLFLDEHNVESLTSATFLRSLKSLFRVLVLLPVQFLYELLSAHLVDHVITVSENDRDSLSRLYRVSKGKISVVPNGVNLLDAYEPTPTEKGAPRTVFFHGTLNWHPNHEAVDKILSYIAPRLPETTFTLAGKNLSRGLLRRVESSRNVRYVGYVPDLQKHIRSSELCVAPISCGGGTKLKVLEYAAFGRPIVATREAVEGMGFTHGLDCLLSERVDSEFIDNIRRVQGDARLAERLAGSARRLSERYSWPLIAEKLYTIYREMVDAA